MALVPYVDADDLSEEYRAFLARPINLFRALANSPAALEQYYPIGEWIRWKCELDGRLRELLILTVGYLTSSEYEWTHHIRIGSSFGVTADDTDRVTAYLKGDLEALKGDDALVVRAAAELTLDRALSDGTAGALTQRFGSARLVDIVVVASFYNMVVRVLGGLRIDNESEFASLLDRFPLPQ